MNEEKDEYHIVLKLASDFDCRSLTEVRDTIDKILNDPVLYDKYIKES